MNLLKFIFCALFATAICIQLSCAVRLTNDDDRKRGNDNEITSSEAVTPYDPRHYASPHQRQQNQQHCHIPAKYFENQGQFCSSLLGYWFRPNYCQFSQDKAFTTHWVNYLSRVIQDESYDPMKRQLHIEYNNEVIQRLTQAPYSFWVLYLIEYYFAALMMAIVPLGLIERYALVYFKEWYKSWKDKKDEQTKLAEQARDISNDRKKKRDE